MKETKLIHFDGEYQYNLEIEDGNKYKLYYNHSECWDESTKGALAFEAEDTGNELKFKTEKKSQFNYSETFYMYLILALGKDYKLEIASIEKEL